MSDNIRPKLRSLDMRPVQTEQGPGLMLQDPLRLADRVMVITPRAAHILSFCDGERDLNQIRSAIMIRSGITYPLRDLSELVSSLDDALLLENDRSADAIQRALAAYQNAEYRLPVTAMPPSDGSAEEMHHYLDQFQDNAEGVDAGHLYKALVSPHIDYERGGSVYSQVFRPAQAALKQTELVIILGTDHNGSNGSVTLTRQHYATPFGVLETDIDAINRLAEQMGEEAVFAEEINHATEHSIELASIWLHYLTAPSPPMIVPILLGTYQDYFDSDGLPEEQENVMRGLQAVKDLIREREVMVVAAGDLAHLGPAFAGPPLDWAGKARMESADQELVEALCENDAGRLYQTVKSEGGQRGVCGLPPFYWLMRLFPDVTGVRAGYERCSADEAGTSWVSICGVLYR